MIKFRGVFGVFIFLIFLLSVVQANGVFVNPGFQTITQGDVFSIEIMANTSNSDIYGIQFDIEYNPDVLSFSSIAEGSFLSNASQDEALFNYSLRYLRLLNNLGNKSNFFKERKNMNNKPQQIPIQLDEKEAEGIYSNFVLTSYTPAEFVLDFARMLPGLKKAKVHSRIVMTPQSTKSLVALLTQTVANYEDKFGEIELKGRKGNQPIGFHASSNLGSEKKN